MATNRYCTTCPRCGVIMHPVDALIHALCAACYRLAQGVTRG